MDSPPPFISLSSLNPKLSANKSSAHEPALDARLREMTTNAERELRRSGMNSAQIAHYWRSMGTSYQRVDEIALLRNIVRSTDFGPMQTVCEVGMNAGHSATAMLDGQAGTQQLVEFDLMTFPYSNATRDVLERRYPGRTHFFAGRSQLLIPLYAARARLERRLPLCDLWFIDGDHETGAILDMRAALNVSRDGAIIVADDCSRKHPRVVAAWRSLIADGFIHDAWNHSGYTKGWCVGRFRRDEAQLRRLTLGFERAARIPLDPISSMYWRVCTSRGYCAPHR